MKVLHREYQYRPQVHEPTKKKHKIVLKNYYLKKSSTKNFNKVNREKNMLCSTSIENYFIPRQNCYTSRRSKYQYRPMCSILSRAKHVASKQDLPVGCSCVSCSVLIVLAAS